MRDKTLNLGIGDPLGPDEGFGERCIERLAKPHMLCSGTQGRSLQPFLEGAHTLAVFPAAGDHAQPGAERTIEANEVPHLMGTMKTTRHQAGSEDMLASAQGAALPGRLSARRDRVLERRQRRHRGRRSETATSRGGRAGFVFTPGANCLSILGDRDLHRETMEFTVILHELCQSFWKAFDCAVLDDAIGTGAREAVAAYKTPSLIFFRHRVRIGAPPMVRDWFDQLVRIARILSARTGPDHFNARFEGQPAPMPSDVRLSHMSVGPGAAASSGDGERCMTIPEETVTGISHIPKLVVSGAVQPALSLVREVDHACALTLRDAERAT